MPEKEKKRSELNENHSVCFARLLDFSLTLETRQAEMERAALGKFSILHRQIYQDLGATCNETEDKYFFMKLLKQWHIHTVSRNTPLTLQASFPPVL